MRLAPKNRRGTPRPAGVVVRLHPALQRRRPEVAAARRSAPPCAYTPRPSKTHHIRITQDRDGVRARGAHEEVSIGA